MGTFKQLHPISLHIIIGTLFARLTTFMTFPFLAIYLTKYKGVSAVEAGTIIGISALVSIFGGFFGGHLSDRFGRKQIMLNSIFVWVFVYVGFALADHVIMFFILNALNGLCRSFFEPSSRALLSDVTEQENKLLVFNLRYAAINVGAAIGPLVGLKIGSASSNSAFLISAIVYFLYGVSLVYMFQKEHAGSLKEATVHEERITFTKACRVLLHDKIFSAALLGITLGVAGYSQFSSTIPQYLSSSPHFKNGLALYSYLIVVNAITVLVTQYPVSRIGKYYSPLTSIMIGTFTVGTGLFLFGLTQETWLLIFAMIVFTVGEVMMFSMTDLFIDQIAKPNMKGLYFGAVGFTSAGGAFGPAIGGFLISYIGFSHSASLFGALALLSICGFPFLLFVSHMLKTNRRGISQGI